MTARSDGESAGPVRCLAAHLFVTPAGNRRVWWRLLLAMVGYFLVLAAAIFGTEPVPGPVEDVVFAAALVTGVVALAWLLSRYVDRRDANLVVDFHARRPGWLRDLVAGLAVGTLVPGLVFAGSLALGWVEIDALLVAPGPFVPSVAVVALLYVGVAINEELFFRGYVLGELLDAADRTVERRALGIAGAVLVSAVLFGPVFHSGSIEEPHEALHYVVAGVVLAVPYLYTRDAWPVVGLHAAFNFWSVTGFNVESADTALVSLSRHGPEQWVGGAGLSVTVAWIVGVAGYAWYLRSVHGPILSDPADDE